MGLGRFFSADPENAGAIEYEPSSWNAYAYVGNNPVNITDPTGLIWLTNGEGWYEWVDDDKYNSDDDLWKGWTEVKSGSMVYFGGEASGRFRDEKNQQLAGGYIILNEDGTISPAPTDENGMIILPMLGTAITFPALTGGGTTGAGVLGVGGVVATPQVAAPLSTGLLFGGSILWLTWLYPPTLPPQPVIPNSATNVSTPPFETQNCACSTQVLQMAKGGKQNIKNHWNDAAVKAVGGDVGKQISWLAGAYKNATNAATKQAIKTAQKAIGGRRSSGGGVGGGSK